MNDERGAACLNCSSAVGAGFYGNEELNKGLQHFIDAAEDVRETITRTQSQVSIQLRHRYLSVTNQLFSQ